MNRQTRYVVVMGVCGSGKTETARRLAAATDNAWLDADDHHPKANVEHMSRGLPLNDEMRWPWLDAVSTAAEHVGQSTDPTTPRGNPFPGTVFIACSALKRRYRDYLRTRLGEVSFVFLNGPRDLIFERMNSRAGHFMPSQLLDSQLHDLEPPGPDEDPLAVSIEGPLEDIVQTAVSGLKQRYAASDVRLAPGTDVK
ncbi:gluconokinase [Thalassospira sp. HJ]|uniref:gluconokinase n=1 Tax=Thalassospira sp. HJ TaxID=1616823 RepID=UPI0005CE0A5B|nr:gluconokinase [Thalassospira sp. HJ]